MPSDVKTSELTAQQLLERRRYQNKIAQQRFRERKRNSKKAGSDVGSTAGSAQQQQSAPGTSIQNTTQAQAHLDPFAAQSVSSVSSDASADLDGTALHAAAFASILPNVPVAATVEPPMAWQTVPQHYGPQPPTSIQVASNSVPAYSEIEQAFAMALNDMMVGSTTKTADVTPVSESVARHPGTPDWIDWTGFDDPHMKMLTSASTSTLSSSVDDLQSPSALTASTSSISSGSSNEGSPSADGSLVLVRTTDGGLQWQPKMASRCNPQLYSLAKSVLGRRLASARALVDPFNADVGVDNGRWLLPRRDFVCALFLNTTIIGYSMDELDDCDAISRVGEIWAADASGPARIMELPDCAREDAADGEPDLEMLDDMAIAQVGQERLMTRMRTGVNEKRILRWDRVPPNMVPTTTQLTKEHHPWIDVGFPWPSVRDRIITLGEAGILDEDELCETLFHSGHYNSGTAAIEAFHIHGDNATMDPEAWELGEGFYHKYWFLFDDSILRRTNYWRRARGMPPISKPSLAGGQPSLTGSKPPLAVGQ